MINTQQANAVRVISVSDDALDQAAMPAGILFEYAENREKYSLVEPYIMQGARPTIYVIQEMRNAIVEMILEQPTEAKRLKLAFRMGLVSIENKRVGDETINPPPFERITAGPLKGGLTDEEMEEFDFETIVEIGEVAFTRSFFRKRTERVYRVPRMLLELWELVVAPRAAQIPALLAQSSAGQSSGTVRTTTTTPAPPSDASTAATAQDRSQAAA